MWYRTTSREKRASMWVHPAFVQGNLRLEDDDFVRGLDEQHPK